MAAAILLTLIRIDGFIYVGAAVRGGGHRPARSHATCAGPSRRADLAAGAGAAYRGALSVLGSLVPTSVEAKVLYKLVPHAHLLIKQPAASYIGQFLSLYGAVFLLAVSAGAVLPSPRPESAVFVLNALFLTMYVSVVGDWMFGLPILRRRVLPLVAVFISRGGGPCVRMRSAWVGRLGAAAADRRGCCSSRRLCRTSIDDVERRDNVLTRDPSLGSARLPFKRLGILGRLLRSSAMTCRA